MTSPYSESNAAFAAAEADVFITPVAADRATLLNAIPRIHFPWSKLLPDLQRQGKTGFTVEFADLSAFSPPPHGEPGHHHEEPQVHTEDNHGEGGHVMYGNKVPGLPQETAAAAWGLFWFDGRIQIERNLRGQQANIDWVLSAEIAHAVDVYYAMGKGMRTALNGLLHPAGPDAHPWFGGPYFEQPGESFMAGFGLAYTDFVQEDPRFLHRFTKAMAPQIRTILQSPRTDEVAPPPPPPPPAEPTLRGATREQFLQEYHRRWGTWAGIDVNLRHTGGVDGAPAWPASFEAKP